MLRTPAFQFSMDPRFRNKRMPGYGIPGPGAYKVAYSSFGTVTPSTKPSSGCFSMGKKMVPYRSMHADQTGPGRCRFDTSFQTRSEDNGKNKGFSFTKRYKPPRETFMTPGPGAYGPPRSMKYSKKARGKVKRKKKAHEITITAPRVKAD